MTTPASDSSKRTRGAACTGRSGAHAGRTAPCALAVVLALLAAGCGTVPPAPGRAQQQAITLNQRAGAAFERGDLRRARELYERALRLDASVENAEGIAVNALSLARVHQAAGETALAHQQLDRLLADGPLPIPGGRKAEAAARKAQIHVAQSEPALARQWAARAEELCGTCPALPAIFNLRARAALLDSDAAGALHWAGRALASAGEARGERANALRLIGEARIASGDYQGAAHALREALALDQALGLAQRVHRDLMLLGRSHDARAEREVALNYYRRALAAAEAAKDAVRLREAELALRGR